MNVGHASHAVCPNAFSVLSATELTPAAAITQTVQQLKSIVTGWMKPDGDSKTLFACQICSP